ncbi:hypothetical protein [Parvicella tangerina]|uniref:Uncharacterized protein n=1 Tax=Parvicella tangerina TaxID=2829795 RepID=A0A916JLC5_9FLAO|nr:hypothetical protein [Parvicella tangerina]CAG5079999.1 hypothetical protein CRYO30217_01146 [Parvicella tangerina]
MKAKLVITFIVLLMLCIGDFFAQSDTLQEDNCTYHYYSNGAVSVKITPWQEQKRTITLYNLEGGVTFSAEDVHMSYSVSHMLKFHQNGAVSEMVESTNPGASRYSYKATMTFNTINEPLKMTKSKTPSSLEDLVEDNAPWFWDKKSGVWKKQETIECQPVKPNEHYPNKK